MKLQVLVSSVNQEIMTLADRMHLQTDAIIVNQTDHFGYEEYMHNGRRIQCYEFQEKGVGLSRNNALLRAEGDIVLFSVLVYELVGPVLTKMALTKAGDIKPKATIVSASDDD